MRVRSKRGLVGAMAVLVRCASDTASPIAVVLVVSTALLTACSWTSSDGSRQHLVFGFGIVTTDDSSRQHELDTALDAKASRLEIAGLIVGNYGDTFGLYLGHYRRQCVEVAADAELMLSAEGGANGLTVIARRPEPSDEE